MGLRPFGGEARFYLLPLYRQDQIPTRPVRLTNFNLINILLVANNY